MIATKSEAKYVQAITRLIGHSIESQEIKDPKVVSPEKTQKSDFKANEVTRERRKETPKKRHETTAKTKETSKRATKKEASHAPSRPDAKKSNRNSSTVRIGWGDHMPAFIQSPADVPG